jgi:2-dehydropantoate 2-reductase
VVQNHSPYRNEFALGELDGTLSERVREFAKIFEQCGVLAPISENIREVLWSKLVAVNMSIMPVCVLTRMSSRVLKNPLVADLTRALMREGDQIARAHDISLSLDPPNPFPAHILESTHKPSMLQDLEAGRPAEIDAILTIPQAFAREAGVPTPHLDSVTALTSQAAIDAGSYSHSA